VDGGQVDLQDAVTTWVTERTKFELLRMSWVKESPDELAYDLVFRPGLPPSAAKLRAARRHPRLMRAQVRGFLRMPFGMPSAYRSTIETPAGRRRMRSAAPRNARWWIRCRTDYSVSP